LAFKGLIRDGVIVLYSLYKKSRLKSILGGEKMGWYWLDKENRITPVSRYCDAGTEQDVIKAINTLKDLQKNKIVWVEEVEKAVRRFDEENRLRRRLEGHQEAIRRWREKAGVDAPPKEVTFYTAELIVRERQNIVEKHYILPIEKNPALFEDAKLFAKNYCRENDWSLRRVYFSYFQGWIMVIEAADPNLE